MKIHFAADGIELTVELEKYANSKIAHLARKVPRRYRTYASFKVVFSQVIRKGTKQCTCDLNLWIDDTDLRAEETTQHMYASLDIAAVHIEQQLRDYLRRKRRGLLGKFRDDG
jgi:putative sigma-54 modulation protein